MLLVRTDNPLERKQLEQQFLTENNLITIPIKHAHGLTTIIKSITYEHFHNSPPALALKMQEYILKSFSLHHCLQLYRDIMRQIKENQEKCQLYEQYISAMNNAIHQQQAEVEIQLPPPQQQNFDELFEQSLRGESHSTSLLEMVDLPLLNIQSNKSDCNNEQAQSEMTKNSSSPSIASSKQTLAGISKFNNFFYSASAIYSRDDWKTQRSAKKEDSKQLDSFKKKGEGVIQANSSLQNLLASEMVYDIKREIHEQYPLNKELKEMQQRYNKRIKDTLLFSKIGMRKRR